MSHALFSSQKKVLRRMFLAAGRISRQAMVLFTTIALLFWSVLPYPILNTLTPVAEAAVSAPVQIQKKTTANPQGARVHQPFAALGINATSSAPTTDKLVSVKVTLADSGSSGFNPNANLSAIASTTDSGIAIYADNDANPTNVNGQFDFGDTLISTTSTSTLPTIQGTGPWTVTWNFYAAIPGNDAGANSGDDFFVVVTPKENVGVVGKKFTVAVGGSQGSANDVIATNGNVGPTVAIASDPLIVVPDLAISEVKVGTVTSADDEFIELYNRSNVTYSATSTNLQLHIRDASGVDQSRNLIFFKGDIKPFGYYLIAGSGYQAAPGREADAIYETATTTVNKLIPNGAVYLSTNATAGTSTTSPALIDFLGWGTQPYGGFEAATSTVAIANDGKSYERKATSTDTTAALMAAGGAAQFKGNAFDSDNNANDFVVQTVPDPQNSSSPPEMPGNVADTIPPTVMNVFPSNSQTNVPPDIQFIGFNFSEPMDPSTVTASNITLSGSPGGTVTYNPFPPQGEPQGKYIPAARPLPASTSFTFTITANARDLAGNMMNLASITTFTTGAAGFTQANTVPPFVTGSSPMMGATNVPTNMAKIVLVFNQKIATSTVTTNNVQLWQVSGTPAQQTISSVSIDSTQKIITAVPAAALTAGQNFEVRLVGGANGLKSNDGAPLPFDSSGIGFRIFFTTGSGPDLTPPKVTGTIPSSGATGIAPGAVDVMFTVSDYMDPTSISTTTVVMKDANNNPIAGTVNYVPANKEGHFIANQAWPLGATLTLTLSSGASGLLNVAATSSPAPYTQLDGDGNGTGGDNYTLSFSTALSNSDITGPSIVSATANDFEISATFNDFLNSSNATDFSNWSLTLGGQPVTLSALAGQTIEYEAFSKTVKFRGLRLTSGASFTLTGSNLRDISGNISVTTSGSGTCQSAAQQTFTASGGGGSGGSNTQTTFGGGGLQFTSSGIGFMPSANVRPFSSFKSASTIYGFDVPITKQIPQNGSIVITFPSGYEDSSISGAIKDTFSPANIDINGPSPSGSSTSTKVGFKINATGDGSSDATKGGASGDGVTVDTNAKTVTVSIDNATRSENSDTHDFLHFDIGGIVNPSIPKDTSTGGYVLDIKTKDASGNLLETITPSALYIMGGGDFILRGKIYPSWSDANAGSVGLNGITVYLDAPMIGRISTTTTNWKFGGDASTAGRFAFTGLASSTNVMVSTDNFVTPTASTTNYIGQTPRSINLDSVLNQGTTVLDSGKCPNTVNSTCNLNFALTPMDGRGVASVQVRLSHAANTFGSTERTDIFAGGPGGFTATTTVPGTGSRDGSAAYVTLPMAQNGEWNVGFGPEMPKGSQMFMGPPPTPDWIMPAPRRIQISGCPSACVTNPSTVTFSITKANKQIVGTVQDASGNGVANAMVFAYKPFNATGSSGSVQMEPGFGTNAQSDSTGKFILKVVDGAFTIGAFSPGFPPSIEMPVVVNTGGVFANGSNIPTTNVIVRLVKPPYKIPGKVVDSNNNPISNASVYAYRTNGPGQANSPTDSSGNFTLWVNNGTYNVEAFLPQYGKMTVTNGLVISGADASALTVTPGSLNTITGRVWKDQDGNGAYNAGTDTPVANAQIRSNGPNGFNNTWTDSNGLFTVRVQAGVYTLGGFAPEFGELAPKTNVDASAGNVSNQNFIVKPPAKVTINIKDSSGNPVTVNRAFIDLFNTASQFGNHAEVVNGTTTQVFVPADTVAGTVYKVFPFVEGVPQSGVTMQSTVSATVISTSTQSVTVDGNETINIVLSSTVYTVSGTVYKTAATSGNELADAWVEIIDAANGQHFGASTNSSGGYTIKIVPGTYMIQAMRPGTLPDPKPLVVSSTGTVTVGGGSLSASAVNLVLKTGTLKISGLISVGGSVPDNLQAFVRAEKKGGGYSGTKVNADGTYDLFVSAGDWRVFAMVEGYQEKEASSPVTVGASSVSGVNINVASSATVSLKKSTSVTVDSTANAIVVDENSTSGSSMKITFDEKAISENDQPATIEIKETNKVSKTSAGVPIESRGKEVTITVGSGSSATKVSTLNKPATLEITYTKDTLAVDGVDTKTKADNLKLAHWSDNALDWNALPTTVLYKDSSGAIVTPTDNLSNVSTVTYKGTTQSFSPGGTINPAVGDATAPSTPSSAPTIVSVGNQRVDISWTGYSDSNSQTISSYNVYRETNANGSFTTAIASTAGKTFTDTTVTNDTTYYYKFSAADNDGDESDNSPVSEAATPNNHGGGGGTTGGSGGGGGGITPAATPVPTPKPGATPSPSPKPSPGPIALGPSGGTPSGATPSTAPAPTNFADGTLVRAEGDTKVYVVKNGVKQLIKTPQEFAQRGFSWAKVKVVAAASVEGLKDTLLVRAKGDAKVYIVKDGTKRLFARGDLLTGAGYKASDVVQIPRSDLNSYRTTALVRVAGKPEIYVLAGGQRQHIVTGQVFVARKYRWENVQELSSSELDLYREGAPLSR